MNIEYDIEIYETLAGKRPFERWMKKLKDHQAAAIIKVRLRRVQLGNLGDTKSVGEGVHELRINFGPGYRIYYGRIDRKIILLLSGGNKSLQEQDILIAKEPILQFLIIEIEAFLSRFFMPF
jgi:putative addiction module killer protein